MSTDYAEMARQLESGTLSPEGFSHRAHVAVAFELLRDREVFDALAAFARGLRMVTETAGVPEKYHATVTFAFVSLIATRMAEQGDCDVETFLDQNPDLLASDVLAAHYPSDVLNADLARRVPVLPKIAVS